MLAAVQALKSDTPSTPSSTASPSITNELCGLRNAVATISTSLRLARPAIEIQLADVHNFIVTPLDKPALTQPAQCFRHRYAV